MPNNHSIMKKKFNRVSKSHPKLHNNNNNYYSSSNNLNNNNNHHRHQNKVKIIKITKSAANKIRAPQS